MKRRFRVLFITMLVVVLVIGCSKKIEDDQSSGPTESSNENFPVVTITMENNDEIILELYPDVAPNTVANFISLINDKTYDGLIFHRVIPDFMIQGGDPLGNGTGGPGYSIKGEFSANKFVNTLAHTRGVISMARSNDLDSAGSQFFIVVKESPSLDGQYASFGKVTSGLDIVDKIVSADRDSQDRPIEDQVIKTITVALNGASIKKLEKIEK